MSITTEETGIAKYWFYNRQNKKTAKRTKKPRKVETGVTLHNPGTPKPRLPGPGQCVTGRHLGWDCWAGLCRKKAEAGRA